MFAFVGSLLDFYEPCNDSLGIGRKFRQHKCIDRKTIGIIRAVGQSNGAYSFRKSVDSRPIAIAYGLSTQIYGSSQYMRFFCLSTTSIQKAISRSANQPQLL